MKSLKWDSLNPAWREFLDPSSNKWSATAIARLVLFLIFAPVWLILTAWAIATQTNWGQVSITAEKVLWLGIDVLVWLFQQLRSVSGTDWLLVCILLLLLRIANYLLALRNTLGQWLYEWRDTRTRQDYEDEEFRE